MDEEIKTDDSQLPELAPEVKAQASQEQTEAIKQEEINKPEENKEVKPPYFIFVILLLLIAFVYFLPEISNFFIEGSVDTPAIIPEEIEEDKKEEKPLKTNYEDKLASATADGLSIDLLDLKNHLENSLEDITILLEEDKLIFTLKDGTKINYYYTNPNLKSSLSINDPNLAEANKIYEALVKEIAIFHGIQEEDILYTLSSDLVNNFSLKQGFTKYLEDEAYHYEIVSNLKFNYLDSSKAYLEKEDLISKENLLLKDFKLSTEFYALEISIEDRVVIYFGEKNKNTIVSLNSLNSIVELLLNEEEIQNFKNNFNEIKDLEYGIFKLERVNEYTLAGSSEYNVIKLTINKKIE